LKKETGKIEGKKRKKEGKVLKIITTFFWLWTHTDRFRGVVVISGDLGRSRFDLSQAKNPLIIVWRLDYSP